VRHTSHIYYINAKINKLFKSSDLAKKKIAKEKSKETKTTPRIRRIRKKIQQK
jgi:hypothetical protein